jgi:predicted transcriptional regulator
MSSFTTTGIVSATPTHPSIGWNNSWVVVENNANRELYAQAMYVTNLDDLKISLSANDLVLDISAINLNTDGIEDLISNSNTFLNKLTAIKYATSDNQEIEITLLDQLTANNYTSISLLKTLTSDDVTFTTLFKTLTSDNITHTTLLKAVTASDVNTNTLLRTLTSLQDIKQSEIITLLTQLTANTDTLEVNTDGVETLLNSLTSLQEDKQNEIITLLHQLTANTDGLEINLDNIEINTDGVETILSVLTANDVVFTTAFKILTSDNTIFTTAFRSLTSNLNTSVTLLRTLTTNDLTFTTLFKTLTADNVTLTSLQKTISTEQVKATTLLNTITGNNVEIISVLNDTLSTLIGLTAIEILNPVTAIEVTNLLSAVEILNPVTAVEVTNLLSAVEILNPVTAIEILNPITAVEIHTDQTLSVSGSVTILNPVTSIEVNIDQVTISNPVTAVTILNSVSSFSVDIENVTVSNPVTAVTILNPVTSFSVDIENVTVSNPVTAVTIIEPAGNVFALNNHTAGPHHGWVMDDVMRPVISFKLLSSSNVTDLMNIVDYQIVINASNGSTATVIYEWWEGDILISGSSIPSWTPLGVYSQYRVYEDRHNNNTGNTFTSNGAILRHSGILINQNTESDSIPTTLYGGATANILTLCLKRVDASTELDVWFAGTCKELS